MRVEKEAAIGMSIIIRLHKYFFGVSCWGRSGLGENIFSDAAFFSCLLVENKNAINRHKQRDMYVRKANGSISFVWDGFFFASASLIAYCVCRHFVRCCSRFRNRDSWKMIFRVNFLRDCTSINYISTVLPSFSTPSPQASPEHRRRHQKFHFTLWVDCLEFITKSYFRRA